MKNGFDLPLDPKEVPPGDENIPLNKMGGVGLNLVKKLKKLELPDQYLRTCTLKEGTIITMCIYQTMALGTAVFLGVMHVFFEKKTTDWWEEKFRNDLDFYYQNENKEMIDKLYPLWKPFSFAIIATHLVFFATGWLVIYALTHRNAHPLCYIPWIVVSTGLNICHWGTCGCMFISVFIFAFYREISVTWDLVPIACAVAYGVAWTYSTAVVIAQYKRRTIVRYWRGRQHLLGMDNFPPEINDYLYQYGTKTR